MRVFGEEFLVATLQQVHLRVVEVGEAGGVGFAVELSKEAVPTEENNNRQNDEVAWLCH